MKTKVLPPHTESGSAIFIHQVDQCIQLTKEIFDQNLLGMYLYGSSVVGGLAKYSDIDLLVVCNKPTTAAEKASLTKGLLKISGIYMKSKERPIEMTVIEQAAVNPWQYPPRFDFQYGEWLRTEFELGNIEPWPNKKMPDLALLITQILLASKTLVGPTPDKLLCRVPYKDFMAATIDAVPNLMADLENDIRNVLLTLARIWSTLETDAIRPKPAAADWVINRLPSQYHPVIQRAKAICIGKEEEHWQDLKELIKPCAVFMATQVNKKSSKIKLSDYLNRSIKLA